MADLAKELEELHASVVRAVRERVDNGSEDEDGNHQPVSNDDLRVALQLLKQNSVTANLAANENEILKGKMAGKLNFSALQQKIIPLRKPEGESPLHTPAEDQTA